MVEGCLIFPRGVGAKLTTPRDSLCPLTADNVDGIQEAAEETPAEDAPSEEAPSVSGSTEGVVTTVKSGKVVISIKEGKDIYLELPI